MRKSRNGDPSFPSCPSKRKHHDINTRFPFFEGIGEVLGVYAISSF